MTPTVDPAPATYSLFWLNGTDRIGRAADIVEASDDTDAVGQAQTLAHGRAVEVWFGAHRVAMLSGPEAVRC